MQWFRSPEKVKYVPVFDSDARPMAVRLESDQYLAGLGGLSGNSAHMGLMLEIARKIRAMADKAETPEELKGYTMSLAVLNWAFTMPEQARDKLKAKANQEQKAPRLEHYELG